MTAKEFLASKTVGDVLQLTWMSDHVITIPSTASVSDAIKVTAVVYVLPVGSRLLDSLREKNPSSSSG